ncbi:MAG: ISAzo13 family transposase [bacterium]|nr:ISAzo13 family transposase [bacterium]
MIHRVLQSDIEEIVDEESQIDPQFKTQRCYVKISAAYVRKELVLNKTYKPSDFCLKTVDNILNRLGYTLKKVLKTRPLKKIPETDAIFENVHKQHQTAKADPRILRISVDVKAKVKVGNLSRKGYSRAKSAPETDDHDQHWTDVLVPFGLHEVSTDNTFLVFGSSKETPDFIADCFEWWWQQRQPMTNQYDLLMIDLDNGKSVAGNTKRFLQRMVGFSKKIGIPIQLVYYPPYHSKYNMVERFWAAVENYWSPLVLDTISNTINIAKKVVWKGMNPIVHFLDKTYQKGITVDSEDFKELQEFIFRNPDLPKWDILINLDECG